MIEAKALKAIREAEIKADRMRAEAWDDCERKVELSRKSATKRESDEKRWALDRAEKIVEHARKEAQSERDKRVIDAEKEIKVMKRRAVERKKKAFNMVFAEVFGEFL